MVPLNLHLFFQGGLSGVPKVMAVVPVSYCGKNQRLALKRIFAVLASHALDLLIHNLFCIFARTPDGSARVAVSVGGVVHLRAHRDASSTALRLSIVRLARQAQPVLSQLWASVSATFDSILARNAMLCMAFRNMPAVHGPSWSMAGPASCSLHRSTLRSVHCAAMKPTQVRRWALF